ncbi:MAG TPA: phosphoglucosamine mutase [Clostridiales bacterium]|nr:phosphoglucosamine mutase [Clostridiales bacterium]
MNTLRFGTDGIRGIYGTTLTEDTAYRLGAALAGYGKILIGRDNRPSSLSLAHALCCGVTANGGTFRAVGVVTTPALYYLLTVSDCDAAVMVTASHNPPEYNGLKVFTKKGKLSDAERREIEERMLAFTPLCACAYPFAEKSDLARYENYVKSKIGDLTGVKVVVDLAGGAGSALRGLYGALGASVTVLNAREDGSRINEGCGALHPEVCREEVLRKGADIGVAIDGDGDRIVAVTKRGTILDGDLVTYLLALRMKARGKLNKDRVVMTVMTNSGVLKSLTEMGVTPLSCAIGDAALASAMQAENLNLGGEQSGHVILGDLLPTGDGLLVGAALMKSILTDGPLDDTPLPSVYPQVLLNVAVKDKSVANDEAVRRAAAEVKEKLKEGRVLLRASGTESLVRIMVEHPDEQKAKRAADFLRSVVLGKA